MRICNKKFLNVLVSIILILSVAFTDVGFGLVGSSAVFADTKTTETNKDKKDSKKKKVVYKNDNVKDKDTIFIDEALEFKGFHVLDTLKKYFDANWNKGFHYNGAVYHGLNYGNVGININYNFATNTQYKYGDKAGYGYNCTGVVTSVMYYASKTDKSIPEFYDRLIEGQGLGRICNGFVWWNFINKYKVKKYCAGRVSNSSDVNKVLNRDRRFKTGYMIYFAPTVRGGDCHLGFYWGKDSKGESTRTRKFSKTLWMKERKKGVSKGYKYQKATYCLRVEKYKRKKVRLCLYKGNTDKKNLVKCVKHNLNVKVK